MSTEIRKNFYCSSCQDTNEYSNIIITLDSCATSGQFIDEKIYNEMLDSLKSIRVFGEKDTAAIRLPDVANLTNKSQYDFVTLDTYENIRNHVLETLSTKSQFDTIYGTYFEDLQDAVNNYPVPETRYYETTTSCCDCYGECSCYGESTSCNCNDICMSYQCSGCEGNYGSGCCQGAVGSCQ